MMDIKELMVGNYAIKLQYDKPGEILKVTPNDIYKGIDGLHPIPITEEWLLKFGFEKINSTWYGFGNFRICISLDVEWGNNWMGIRLKYIHQLQNLYFTLTEYELELI